MAAYHILINSMHKGMVIVELPYSFAGQMRIDEMLRCTY
jgi:hypothetical protein